MKPDTLCQEIELIRRADINCVINNATSIGDIQMDTKQVLPSLGLATAIALCATTSASALTLPTSTNFAPPPVVDAPTSVTPTPTATSGGGGGSTTPIAKVCFYTEAEFKGRRFCESGLRGVNVVPEHWRGHIKSVQISDAKSVQICSDFYRDGTCDVLRTSEKELGPDLFNQVYSYRIKG